jgi:mono/diheme cytochrome c family protein
MSAKRVVQGLAAGAVVWCGLVVLPGCDERYSKDMTYPVRTDVLVTTTPQLSGDATLDTPGHFAYLLPSFQQKFPNNLLDPMKLTAEQRGQFERVLTGLFGTPAEPKMDLQKAFVKQLGSDVDPFERDEELAKTRAAQARQELQLDDATLAEGSKLYRHYCLYCHGLPGDGHGPTAAWVNPHPRDFRPGKFKFMSSKGGNARKPRRDDLLRTLRQGIEGTAMPMFGLLPDKELQALASYATHLSVRGQAEYDVMIRVLSKAPDLRSIEREIYESVAATVAGSQGWLDSNGNPIVPGSFPYPELKGKMTETDRHASIRDGWTTFKATCIACHKDYGRRNNFIWDDWGTVVRPADLTVGTYRGGRRPLDLYWRVEGGIGTYMPKYDQDPKSVWDLVTFIQALPYPAMLPDEIRKEVYGAQ